MIPDFCLYKMLDQVYIFPESHRGKHFCRQFPTGPIDEKVVLLMAQKENLKWRTYNYEHS